MTPLFPLDALLDTLLPGDGAWPAAASLNLGERMLGVLQRSANGEAGLDLILGALPPDFATDDVAARGAALSAVETHHPEAFEHVVSAAYVAYYTDPAVRTVLAAETAFPDRPPQPLGHALSPFDPGLLTRSAARAPFWRSDTP